MEIDKIKRKNKKNPKKIKTDKKKRTIIERKNKLKDNSGFWLTRYKFQGEKRENKGGRKKSHCCEFPYNQRPISCPATKRLRKHGDWIFLDIKRCSTRRLKGIGGYIGACS